MKIINEMYLLSCYGGDVNYMKKNKIFETPRTIIQTPMLSNKDYSSIANVEVYLNEYGALVISATNHDGGTGYYSLSLEDLFKDIDKEALILIKKKLDNELENINKADQSPT